jgi:hypothetical protein
MPPGAIQKNGRLRAGRNGLGDAWAISFRCSTMPCVVQRGSTKPAPFPAARQMAPKI